jgi:hypothetical protein
VLFIYQVTDNRLWHNLCNSKDSLNRYSVPPSCRGVALAKTEALAMAEAYFYTTGESK